MGHSQLCLVITVPCLPRSASPTTRCERYQSEGLGLGHRLRNGTLGAGRRAAYVPIFGPRSNFRAFIAVIESSPGEP